MATNPTMSDLSRILSLPLDPTILLSERATLLKAISTLDTRRNQLAPISKLSPELLSEIFLVVAAYSRASAAHPGYLSAAEVRVCTTGVCHHWRSVALGCASLWSYIDFSWDSPDRVRESLLRSKATPLVVQASLHRRLGLGNILLAFEDTSRIQCLDLGFNPDHFTSFAHGLLKAAPALEVLRLNCDHSSVRLPPELFASQTPRLRELELRGCVIPEDSYLFRNLTYLSFDGAPPDCTFTAFQWLEILDSLPLLQVLSLSTCFARKPREHLPLIQLPELFSLALEGSMEDCSDMLSHIVFPPTPCLEIKCYSADFVPDLVFFSTLIDALGNILKNLPETQTLRSLGISWTVDGVKLRASTDQTGDVSPGSEDSEFYLAFVPEQLTFLRVLALLDVLPTSDIVVLDLATPLCHCPPPSHWAFRAEDDWPGLLRRFPAVHTLRRIQYDWASAVLSLLTPPPLGPAADVVLLPALHTLGFVNTAFDIPAIIPSLMKLLRWRMVDGGPIKTISADFCKNVLSKMEMLREVGVAVKWDGKDGFEGEEEEAPFVPRTRRLRAN
ncbi:hypothetical protein FB451DRAFT_1265560 [Mycena latifolia]|nr:hypothetical protein FB451DRAFT_1265560 [Mycena latifolia]